MRPAPNAERLAQAVADLAFDPWRAFAPALGADFAHERFPATARVLAAVTSAIASPINSAKAEYDRPRPYAANRAVLQCDDPDPNAGAGGSYPTGHGAAGWAWALTLAELAPARTDAILRRGRDFGDSRVICGYHFPSDIDAARLIAAGVVARLHADAHFRRDLDAARRELSRAYPN
jgi:acid phosphatase (class A)